MLVLAEKKIAENKNFNEMSSKEKDKLTQEIVMGQFLFAKTIAHAFGVGQKKEIMKFILEESTKELEKYLEKKMGYLIVRGDCKD